MQFLQEVVDSGPPVGGDFGAVEVDFEVAEVGFAGLEAAEGGAGGEEGLEDCEAGLPVKERSVSRSVW